MRVDKLPKIAIDGYDEFEVIAQESHALLQENVNSQIGDGREFSLQLDAFDKEVVSYARNILKLVRPVPDEVQRKMAEKSFTFGVYLAALLAHPEAPRLSTDSLFTAGSLADMEQYVQSAPGEYLRHRPYVLGLIDLLQPTPGANQTQLVRDMAGLAVMQCEEGRVEAFLREQDQVLASELEKMGGILPDDWR